MLINRTLYVAFVVLLGFSPVLSIYLANLFGLSFSETNMWKLMWVSVGLSLPVTLLIARMLGHETYSNYWTYLQSFRGSSKARITAAWIGATVVTLAIGVVAISLDWRS